MMWKIYHLAPSIHEDRPTNFGVGLISRVEPPAAERPREGRLNGATRCRSVRSARTAKDAHERTLHRWRSLTGLVGVSGLLAKGSKVARYNEVFGLYFLARQSDGPLSA